MDEKGQTMGEDIDAILSRRPIPEPRDDLMARIIAEAARHPQERGAQGRTTRNGGAASGGLLGGLRDWWSDFADGFALPQPALVMSLVLLLGVVAGGYGLDGGAFGTEDEDAPFGVVVLDTLDMEDLS